MDLLFITLPIFLLIALGYVLRVCKRISPEGIRSLNTFVYYVSLPAVILISFWGIDWFNAETRQVLLMNTVAIVGFAIFLFLLLRLFPFGNRTKAGMFISALVGNTVYMGFPIGERALGAGSYDLFLAAATPHLVIGIALSVLAIEWYILKAHSPIRYLKDFFGNPLIIALALGIVLSVTDANGSLITLLKQPLTMLAATASPLALVSLGAFLYGVFRWRLAGLALMSTTLKLLILPCVIYLAGLLFVDDPTITTASVIAAAMPTAVTSFVVAQKYDAAPQFVATTLFMSTVVSLGTITLTLFLVL